MKMLREKTTTAAHTTLAIMSKPPRKRVPSTVCKPELTLVSCNGVGAFIWVLLLSDNATPTRKALTVTIPYSSVVVTKSLQIVSPELRELLSLTYYLKVFQQAEENAI
jgi:hypothetical protein